MLRTVRAASGLQKGLDPGGEHRLVLEYLFGENDRAPDPVSLKPLQQYEEEL